MGDPLSGAGNNPQIKSDFETASAEGPAPRPEVRDITRKALSDGLQPDETAWADGVVSQLEADRPDRSSTATQVWNAITGHADNHDRNLGNARFVQRQFQGRAGADAQVAQHIGDAPTGATTVDDFRQHYAQSVQRMRDDGMFEIPPGPDGSADRSQAKRNARRWRDAGTGDAFRHQMQAYAHAVSQQFPPGHPQRAEALAGAYQALAEKVFVHVGSSGLVKGGDEVGFLQPGQELPDGFSRVTDMDYSAIGASSDPDFSDLFYLRAPDGRMTLDCEGFVALSQHFFEGTGSDVRTGNATSKTDPLGHPWHKIAVVDIDGRSIGISNHQATTLPARDDARFSAQVDRFATSSTGNRWNYGVLLNDRPRLANQ